MKNFFKCLFGNHLEASLGGNWYECKNCRLLGKLVWYDPYDEDGNSPFVNKYIKWGMEDYQLEVTNRVRKDDGLKQIERLAK